nr:hypothetical protein BaRGS_029824 [Batillaria attramentaria]
MCSIETYVTSPDSVSTYFLVVSSVSTLLAMYGLVVLFRSTRRHLETHNVTPKFFVLQLMLVVLNLQGFVIKFLADRHIPPCSNGVISSVVRGEAIQHMLLIAETFLLALGARVVYRKPLKREMDEEELDSADEKLERTLKDIPTNDKARLIKNIDPIDVRSYHSVNDTTDARESAARIVDLMDNAGRTAYEKIRNEEQWERAGKEPVAKQILRRKWGWIGHIL